jgi:hypothetical protein
MLMSCLTRRVSKEDSVPIFRTRGTGMLEVMGEMKVPLRDTADEKLSEVDPEEVEDDEVK